VIICQIVCQILTYAEIGTDISSGDTLFGIYAAPTKHDDVVCFGKIASIEHDFCAKIVIGKNNDYICKKD